MRRILLALLACAFIVPASASADPLWVTYNGMNFRETVRVNWVGHWSRWVYAGEMNLTIDGLENAAYCIDLAHWTVRGQRYKAELQAMPNESPWTEISWLVENRPAHDNASAAALQIAIWKLTYGVHRVRTNNADLERRAHALIREADHAAVLSCDDDIEFASAFSSTEDGTVELTVQVTVDGAPVSGLAFALDVDGTSFDAETGADGTATVTFDPAGATAFAATADLEGRVLYRIRPRTNAQTLLTFTWETCNFPFDASWEVPEASDARPWGWWRAQSQLTAARSRGAEYTSREFKAFGPFEVFGTEYVEFTDMYLALTRRGGFTTRDFAEQACLATRLNVASGRLDWLTDTRRGPAVYELWAEAADAYAEGDYRTAYRACSIANF